MVSASDILLVTIPVRGRVATVTTPHVQLEAKMARLRDMAGAVLGNDQEFLSIFVDAFPSPEGPGLATLQISATCYRRAVPPLGYVLDRVVRERPSEVCAVFRRME